MLINKGVSVGEVITLKLTSGEELVAKLVEETDSYYKLSRIQVIGTKRSRTDALLVYS